MADAYVSRAQTRRKRPEDRVLEKISPCPNTGCWFWTASDKHKTKGYGQVWYGGRNTLAHRAVYTILVGEIPYGLELDHQCNIGFCVNPDHLVPSTRAENLARRDFSKARRDFYKKSFIHHNSKKTHCKNGHAFSEENTGFNNRGHRVCKACDREMARRKYKRRKHLD